EQPGKGGFCFTATGGGKKHDMPGEVIHAQPEFATDIVDTAVTVLPEPLLCTFCFYDPDKGVSGQ
ncbi:hypothetical protein ACUOJG_27125, partial [Escherichia coli]